MRKASDTAQDPIPKTQDLLSGLFVWVLALVGTAAVAQQSVLTGTVRTVEGKPLHEAVVTLKGTRFHAKTAQNGTFRLPKVPYGQHTVVAFAYGRELTEQTVSVQSEQTVVDFRLAELSRDLDVVVVQAEREKTFGVTRLRAVENFGIYEGKKTEVVVLRDVTANLATNNPRQIFARVPSLNIWENDRAGLQLSIGARGLNPNRTANFNTRQNGYDIAAESIGYPESYYTPPMEALERIEVVRGAASLQYGPQFGGMVNFVMRKPSEKRIEVTSRQTGGSWGFFNTFNSVSGSFKKIGYYGFHQYKTGAGWRPNSAFDQHTAYLSLPIQVSEKLRITPEYTYMGYLAQQPGGLTDLQFETDARQSNRARNWFKVDWNLLALTADYRLSDRTQLNWRTFVNLSGRESLGNLERINTTDIPGTNRTLIRDRFQNVGSEARLLHRYGMGRRENHLLVGARVYRSRNPKQQGDANAAAGPDFYYLNPNELENSDFVFRNTNVALFAEHIFNLSDKFSITPGLRWEHIRTDGNGYYRQRVFDAAGNLVAQQKINETQRLPRSFALLGLGLSYKHTETTEYYANFSQNYRAVTFSDLRIVNQNISIDPNLTDERGYNADLGVRGGRENRFNYDVSAFYMRYNNRIDLVPRNLGEAGGFRDVRFRTNIGTSRHVGVEAFGEWNVWPFFGKERPERQLSVFGAVTVADARYVSVREAIRSEIQADVREGNAVPFAPQFIGRGGVVFKSKSWRAAYQTSYTSLQYSDAANSNSRREPTATLAPVFAYYVMDFSLSFQHRAFTFEGSVNNLTDNRYFTRRAESYPGPGIIPADGRAFYLTIQCQLGR